MKVNKEGDKCKKCFTPVTKITHPKGWEPKKDSYYFEWWLKCPYCKTVYFIKETRKYFTKEDKQMKLF